MSITLSAGELINIAIGIEKQGAAYYDVMAKSTWHELARDLFQHLAGMEKQHITTFQAMLDDAAKDEAPLQFTAEHEAYMQALIENAVFTDELAASELATHLDNEIEAIDIAIDAEKHSILFYYQMKEIIPPSIETVVQKILMEEKVHLSQLAEIKKRLVDMQ